MKCPKCGYLGFERVERCRNCGYDFSLAQVDDLPEFPLREDSADLKPLDDLSLVDAAAPNSRGQSSASAESLREPDHSASRRGAPASGTDLPLFGSADDAPLITRVSPPRPPLAVRRATPEVPRLRTDAPRAPATPMFDLDALDAPGEFDDVHQPDVFTPAARALATDRWPATATALRPQSASLFARVVAGGIDLFILAVVDLLVVYFTMKICGLTSADLGLLPKVPLVAFLLMQNGGYLVTFTAGGQTLGKMAAGIRVIPARDGDSLDMGRSFVRTVVWVALAVPAGLGFLTTLFNSDRRGLHDRCAGTRVVRVSA